MSEPARKFFLSFSPPMVVGAVLSAVLLAQGRQEVGNRIEREFERLGGTRTLRVDVRLITATNRNLAQMVSSGQFREDLYYRLNVVTLTLPTLAERRDDIPLLANHFLDKLAAKYGRRLSGFAPEALTNSLCSAWRHDDLMP